MAKKTVNRSELVAQIAQQLDASQASVNGVLDALFNTMATSVAAGDKVSIPGWFSAEATTRAARTGRNPRTGEAIQIPASKGVKLTAGSKLKAAVK
jgi:DNA-binding protein HU-beta